MGWINVDSEPRQNIVSVSELKGHIVMPPHQEGILGETKKFAPRGINDNNTTKKLQLQGFVYNPNGDLIGGGSKSADIGAGSGILLEIPFDLNDQGEYSARAELYIYY